MKMDLKKQPKSILLKNGTIIDPHTKKSFSGHVWIKNGKIEITLFIILFLQLI